MKVAPNKVKESKREALEKIKNFLDCEEVDAQFSDRSGSYHSSDKFIVSWTGNYNGMAHEFSIDKTDSFYASYSGYRAIYARRTLFSEKQIAGYTSIERALIEVGLKLCQKSEKKEFFEKYGVRYNLRIQLQRESSK